MNRTPSNITVIVPDVTGVAEAVAKNLWDSKQVKFDNLTMCGRLGYVQTARGIFVLDDDGVGGRHPVSQQHRAEFWFYGENIKSVTDKETVKTFNPFPVGGIGIGEPEELLALPVKERVPLEQFIRTFGHRLEANYAIWLDVLTKAMKPVRAKKAKVKA